MKNILDETIEYLREQCDSYNRAIAAIEALRAPRPVVLWKRTKLDGRNTPGALPSAGGKTRRAGSKR
jgi:hypothetical protein